jgi:hypothetical protein
MAWYYIVQSDGALVSESATLPTALTVGQRVIEVTDRINADTMMWDKASQQFVPRPKPVVVDRLNDLMSSADFSDFASVWSSLDATRRQKLRDAVIRLLGTKRFREQNEPASIQD